MKFQILLLATILVLASSQNWFGNNASDDKDSCTATGSSYVNGLCKTNDDHNTCMGHLVDLQGSGESNKKQNWSAIPDNKFEKSRDSKYKGSLWSDCYESTNSANQESKKYEFLIQLTSDFDFDYTNCFKSNVYFFDSEDTKKKTYLSKGTGSYSSTSEPRTFFYNEADQTYRFNIDQSDIDVPETLGCKREQKVLVKDGQPDKDQLVWTCNAGLDINYGSKTQMSYTFDFVLRLDLAQNASVDVSIEQSRVDGKCCDKSLKIATKLAYCTDNTNDCDTIASELDTPYERQVEFHMVHYHDNQSFYTYGLSPISLKFGPFSIALLEKNIWQKKVTVSGTERGAGVMKVSSSIAFDDLQAVVVSNITLPSARRVLADSDDDVKETDQLKAFAKVKVARKGSTTDTNKTTSANILMAGISLLLAVLLC